MVKIKTYDDLKKIKTEGNYIIECDIDCKGKNLNKIVCLFKGQIDGQNHKIYNACISSKVSSDGESISLFQRLNNACIKNIIFENITIINETKIYKPHICFFANESDDTAFDNLILDINSNEKNITMVYDSFNCNYSKIIMKVNGKESKSYHKYSE